MATCLSTSRFSAPRRSWTSFAGLVALVVLGAAPLASAQSLRSVIDEGTLELARRQKPDGSYEGDVVTTADAILAFREAPRRYAETDGPFLSRAVAWLTKQVGPDGAPLGGGDVHEKLALAGWIEQALAPSKNGEAKEALTRLAKFRESDAVRNRGDAKTPEAEFVRTFTLPAKDEASAVNVLDTITPALAGKRELNPGEFDRWLATMPSICADLAARFPQLQLETTGGGKKHWTKVLGSMVVGALQAPAGFEEANALHVAAACRTLTICHEKAPKEPSGPGSGATAKPTGTPRVVGADLNAAYADAAKAALAYLEAQQKDGSFAFMGQENAGVTALALSAVIRTSRRLGQPWPKYVDGGLDHLLALQKANGAIHAGSLAVYTTSASILALTDANRPQDRAAIEKATTYLKVAQLDEKEGYDPHKDWGYGGIGYGDELRPDLSNTQFGVEAMKAGGVSKDDDAMQRAILFLQRCQNYPETNPLPIVRADGREVVPSPDGGAGYQPGDSKAGLVDNGNGTWSARSYGSMTYALLKCYLFAGVPLADSRVQAALHWIEKHWTVDLNPGFDPSSSQGAEYQGLYYYYFTMAKALDATGLEQLTTPDGKPHAWRDELLHKLLENSMQEGFWTNQKSSRWMEEFPVLATSYALVAMDCCLGKKPDNGPKPPK